MVTPAYVLNANQSNRAFYYLKFNPTSSMDGSSHHFYQLPVLNITGVSRLVTFSTPCNLCGRPRADGIHGMRNS